MVNTTEVIIRLLVGAALGGIIGFERQSHGRAAGFRTHLLVSMASVIIMLVSLEFYEFIKVEPSFIRIDPARIAAGAITGVGFLGAGVIVKSGFTIQGLTTAACIWTVSAIGLAVGAGLYVESLGAFLITLTALWCLRRVEDRMPRLRYRFLNITTTLEKELDPRALLEEADLRVYDVHYDIDKTAGHKHYNLSFTYRDINSLWAVVRKLEQDSEVLRIQVKG